MSNTSIAALAICFVLQHADQSLLFDDRPARRIDQPGRWLHSLQLRGPYQAARTAAQHQMDRQDGRPLEQLVLGNDPVSMSPPTRWDKPRLWLRMRCLPILWSSNAWPRQLLIL